MKKITRFLVNKIFLSFLLLFGLVGFWIFEPSVFYLSILGLIALFVIWESWIKKKFFNLIIVDFYLLLVFLYNIYYSYAFPLPYITIIVILVGIFFHWVYHELNGLPKSKVFQLESATFGLLLLEIFIALKFWPIDPKVKSFIIVGFFYLWESFIRASFENKLVKKEIVNYLAVVLFLILIIILTSRWFGF